MPLSSSSLVPEAPIPSSSFYNQIYDLVRFSDAFGQALVDEDYDRERAILRVVKAMVPILNHASDTPPSGSSFAPCPHRPHEQCITFPFSITFPLDPETPDQVGTLYFNRDAKVKTREGGPRPDIFNPDKWKNSKKSHLLELKKNNGGDVYEPFYAEVPEQPRHGHDGADGPRTGLSSYLAMSARSTSSMHTAVPITQETGPEPDSGLQNNLGIPINTFYGHQDPATPEVRRRIQREYAFCMPDYPPRPGPPPRYPPPPPELMYESDNDSEDPPPVPYRQFVIRLPEPTSEHVGPASSTDPQPSSSDDSAGYPVEELGHVDSPQSIPETPSDLPRLPLFNEPTHAHTSEPEAVNADDAAVVFLNEVLSSLVSRPPGLPLVADRSLSAASTSLRTSKKRAREEDGSGSEERPSRRKSRGALSLELVASTSGSNDPPASIVPSGPARPVIEASPSSMSAAAAAESATPLSIIAPPPHGPVDAAARPLRRSSRLTHKTSTRQNNTAPSNPTRASAPKRPRNRTKK